MKVAVLLTLFAVAYAAPQSVRWFKMEPAQPLSKVDRDPLVKTEFGHGKDEFENFKNQFSKIYLTVEEEKKRFDTFMKNLEQVSNHNTKYLNGEKSYFLRINQFSDMEHDEYIKLNGFNKSRKLTETANSGCSSYLSPANVALPKSVDWRTKGYVTKVKNQGSCGSCWAFSTTGSLEGQHFKATGKLVSLSEQQLVDCSGDFGNDGCNGGLMDNAFAYIKSVKGLEGENDYKYKAEDEKCHYKPNLVKANDTGCVDVQSGSESALQEAVTTVGPISVAIDASHPSFQQYGGGVYDEPKCSSKQLDHGVLAVGYGTDKDGVDYWIVKNSWSDSWGLDGYVHMSRNNDNQCGIATQASYPLV